MQIYISQNLYKSYKLILLCSEVINVIGEKKVDRVGGMLSLLYSEAGNR